MNFRNATRHDLLKIVEIYNTTIPSRMVTADLEPITVESRVTWFENHSPERRPLWMVEDDDKKIIGWVSFNSFYGRPAYDGTVEVSIYLDESARGKGFGKVILQECMRRAGGLKIKTLLGFIFAHNEPSLKLFKNAGFEQWALLPNIAVLDNVERSLIILGKRVS